MPRQRNLHLATAAIALLLASCATPNTQRTTYRLVRVGNLIASNLDAILRPPSHPTQGRDFDIAYPLILENTSDTSPVSLELDKATFEVGHTTLEPRCLAATPTLAPRHQLKVTCNVRVPA